MAVTDDSIQAERAALYAVLINLFSTCLKFAMAWLTGSLAVAAEAYHSFSDIITSALVHFAIRVDRTSKNRRTQAATSGDPGADSATIEEKGLSYRFFREKLEDKISFFIGIFLLVIALRILADAWMGAGGPIENSVPAGFAMLAAALASYLLSQFEMAVGEKHHSIALTADGHHARVDMLSAVLVAASLFSNAAGLDIDTPAAAVIGILILFQALETLVNVVRTVISGDNRDDKPLFYMHQRQIISEIIFNRNASSQAWLGIERFTGLSIRETRVFKLLRFALPALLTSTLTLWWLSTCFVTVRPPEQALLFRFGKLQSRDRAIGPGLLLKLPWPADSTLVVPVKRTRRITVGFEGDTTSDAILWTRKHHKVEYEMLTGDAQFITVFVTVDYHIADLSSYYLTAADPDEILSGIANAVVIDELSRLEFFDIAIFDRRKREITLKRKIQLESDRLGLGLAIDMVAFKDIHPPVSVAPEFEAVISAIEQKESIVNQAQAIKNRLIPLARAQAARKISQARAYRVAVTGKARGRAQRFRLRRPASETVRKVMRLQLLRRTQMSGAGNPAKILVGPGCPQPGVFFVPAQLIGQAAVDNMYEPND